MKKTTILMALACLVGSAAASAAPAVPRVNIDLSKAYTTPLQQQHFRATTAKALSMVGQDNSANKDVYTRTWTDPKTGNEWTMQLLKDPTPICELLMFQDDDGNPFQYTFEEMPFYTVNYILWMRDAQTQSIVTQLYWYMCWPCHYIWDQVWNYDGPLDENGGIPDDLVNWDIVTPDELLNSTQFCRTFTESNSVGAIYNEGKTGWAYFTMLPNQQLDFQGQVQGNAGYTTVSETTNTGSSIEFQGYEPDGDILTLKETINFTSTAGRKFVIRNAPSGQARVEGFSSKDYKFEFGDVNLFNMGIGGRETYGELDAYPEEWGPLSQLYLMTGDKYVLFRIPEDMTKFDPSQIGLTISDQLPEGESVDEHANLVQGMLYAAPEFSNDIELNPSSNSYQLINPIAVEDPDFGKYLSIAPKADSFVPYGYDDQWSDDYGTNLRIHNFLQTLGSYGQAAFGTKEGFVFDCTDYFGNHIKATSKGNVNYYYDPNDIKKVRQFSCVGDKEFVQVEGVVADKAVVAANNGAITVTPAADAQVAVYSVAGNLVGAANVAAGREFRVAADNGLYIVVVNGETVKVVL